MKRIAILGGGAGAMSAAFWLSNTLSLRRRYQITVYQQGWRLGGKGASGRNAQAGQRIEEHGLHMFLGSYENTFRLLRACYREWDPAPDNPFQRWSDAFEPLRQITLPEQLGRGEERRWEPWTIRFPRNPGKPGDGKPPLDPGDFLAQMERWLVERVRDMHHELADLDDDDAPDKLARLLEALIDGPGPLPGLFLFDEPLQALERLAARLDRASDSSARTRSDRIRNLTRMLRLGLVITRGYARDVLPHGADAFHRINHLEFREWLRRNGAERDLTWWAPVRALYTLGFAFEKGRNGDPSAAKIAAGVALKVLIRLAFGYKDAPLWKMKGGMGDVVFAPLYEVLRARGVEFRFFHRVQELRLDRDAERVDRIEIDVQAEAPDYQPLVDVKGMRCWPSEPLWEQILHGPYLRELGTDFESAWQRPRARELTLCAGEDFDQVVLGIPLGALKTVCRELVMRKRRWWRMVNKIPTVRTQSVQLWLKPPLDELGWKAGETVMTAYSQPLDSWELSHLIPFEDWGDDEGAPRSLHYLTATLPHPDDEDPELGDTRHLPQQTKLVRKHAAWWARDQAAALWPEAVDERGRLRWELLADPQEREGEARLDAQYWRANCNPSDLYVQSFPKTIRYRMSPGDSGLENLTLAGDWTRTGLNAGSAEAAVQSGALASRSICGVPRNIADDPETD